MSPMHSESRFFSGITPVFGGETPQTPLVPVVLVGTFSCSLLRSLNPSELLKPVRYVTPFLNFTPLIPPLLGMLRFVHFDTLILSNGCYPLRSSFGHHRPVTPSSPMRGTGLANVMWRTTPYHGVLYKGRIMHKDLVHKSQHFCLCSITRKIKKTHFELTC